MNTTNDVRTKSNSLYEVVADFDDEIEAPLLEKSQSLMYKDDSRSWSFFNFMCFPFLCCCSWNRLEPMQHAVVSKWFRPVKVWKEPGMYFLGPIGSAVNKVYVGLKSIEIKQKVNDSIGNPVIVSAQLAYKVTDAVKAIFCTNNLERYLIDQAKSAITSVASKYPYDIDDFNSDDFNSKDKGRTDCLRKTSKKINQDLTKTLMNLIGDVGIQIKFFRIQSVGYEAGMEKILLARQEAHANVIAKDALTKGLAGIASSTINNLEKFSHIKMTREEKVIATTNLLFLLTHQGDTTLNLFPAQPTMQSIFVDKRN